MSSYEVEKIKGYGSPLIHFVRDEIIENCIYGSYSIVSGTKEISGLNSQQNIFLRSLAKPFQIKCILHGLRDLTNWKSRSLSVSSHNGTNEHVKNLRYITPESDWNKLKLPNAAPLHNTGGDNTVKSQKLHCCSGVHLAILKACENLNWDTDSYLTKDHKHFKYLLREIKKVLGSEWNPTYVGLDGCLLPTIGTSLTNIATLYSHLVRTRNDNWIWEAMTRHPEMVGGDNRLDSNIISCSKGRAIAKEGAGGLLGIGLVTKEYPQGIGIVIKVYHGWDSTALRYVACYILKNFGIILEEPTPPLNCRVVLSANIVVK